MFEEWDHLLVRLDIWHFMRRFAVGCSSESHALYASFMSRLSSCIFEWNMGDYNQLKAAKLSELQSKGVWQLGEDIVNLHLTKKELQQHCRRRTRGVEVTTNELQKVLDLFSSDKGKDTMGIPLMDPETTRQIWAEQQKHVACIQDPEGPFQLYTKTGTLRKGGKDLPVYRCARGSTSLESFHLHINRFIPGKTMLTFYHMQL